MNIPAQSTHGSWYEEDKNRESRGEITSGESLPELYGFPTPPEWSAIASAHRKILGSNPSEAVRVQAEAIFGAIHRVLNADQNSVILPLKGAIQEDGSALLEWISPNYRVGISLEADPRESSWHLISDESMGNVSASGDLEPKSVLSILVWLMFFMRLDVLQNE